MKMTTEHYQFIKEKMIRRCKDVTFRNDCLLSPMRYRWDLFNLAIPVSWVCKNLYPYLNDDHIDTALRKITKT